MTGGLLSKKEKGSLQLGWWFKAKNCSTVMIGQLES